MNGETQTKQTIGWLVMQTLRNYGIDTVFGIPGTHNLEFYRPLTALGIRPVTTRHEQGAGYAADGWSLQTGKPGVVLTTSGPGLLNALSAAGTGYCESRPMIILSPGPARGAECADVGALHETKDQLAAASAIVEWGRRVHTAVDAVQAVHDAFDLFTRGRPRPVYIEVPRDLLAEQAELAAVDLIPRDRVGPPSPDPESIAAAAGLLTAATDPVILAGGGARHATEPLRRLAERLNAPVVTTVNGKGALDEHHPLSLGSNLRLAAARNRARDADVLLVIGSKLGAAELWVDRLQARGRVIRIDRVPSQIEKNQPVETGIVADSKTALAALVAALPTSTPSGTGDQVAARVTQTLTEVRAECWELSAVNAAIAEDIAAALPENAIVATDSSQIAYWGLINLLRVARPNSMPYMTTYATLGYGLPAALGTRIAEQDRPVFAVVGDGALMFSVQELITVVEQRLDVTVIVVDNGGYAEIKQNEWDAGIAPIAVDLTQPDWAALGVAFGGSGRRVTSASELSEAITIAGARGGLNLIHLHLPSYQGER